EQRRHLGGRLEMALGVGEQKPPGAVERGAVADAGEDGEERPAGGGGGARAAWGGGGGGVRGGGIGGGGGGGAPPAARGGVCPWPGGRTGKRPSSGWRGTAACIPASGPSAPPARQCSPAACSSTCSQVASASPLERPAAAAVSRRQRFA